MQKEKNRFFREAEESVALNPNNPASIGFIEWAMALYGDWEHGLALQEKGIGLNPLFPGRTTTREGRPLEPDEEAP